jgi:hypothetical protein
MIGALVDHAFGRGIIIDTQEDCDGETEYLISLFRPIVWSPNEIYQTYWVPNETAFEVLSES